MLLENAFRFPIGWMDQIHPATTSEAAMELFKHNSHETLVLRRYSLENHHMMSLPWRGKPKGTRVIFAVRFLRSHRLNPFTPNGDQFQISPSASPEILHHIVWRIWLFIAYSDERWSCYQFSLPHLYISLLKGWENVLFELWSERVKSPARVSSRQLSSDKSPQIRTCSIFSATCSVISAHFSLVSSLKSGVRMGRVWLTVLIHSENRLWLKSRKVHSQRHPSLTSDGLRWTRTTGW